jgi:hypothetical protein
MANQLHFSDSTNAERIQNDFKFLDALQKPVATTNEAPLNQVEEDDKIGEREAYMIGNYGGQGYVASPQNYPKYLEWRKKNQQGAFATITDAIGHAAGTMLGGAWDMVKTGDIAKPHTLAGTTIEAAYTGTQYFLNMLDVVKYDPASPIHRALFTTGTPEEQYQDYLKLSQFNREMATVAAEGRFIPREFDVGGVKLKGFNKAGVAGGSMVLDPTVIFPPMKIGGAVARALGKTAIAIELGEHLGNAMAKGSIQAEKMALSLEKGAAKTAGVGEGVYNYVGNKIENLFGIENITTSNGKIVPKEQILRTAQGALFGTALLHMPYVAPAAGLWATAKVTEVGARTMAEAISHARTPHYLSISERLAYQSSDAGVRTIGKMANFSSGFTDYLGRMAQASFHGSIYGAGFGYALGGEEGLYHGIGTGIGLGGSMHMLGSVYGIYGNRSKKQIDNVMKHFAYVAEGFDAPKKEGVEVLLKNVKEQHGDEAMYKVMAGIAATERLQKNGTHLILTTDKIRDLLGDADWQEYQKELSNPQFGGYTTRRKDGRVFTIINADHAAPSAISGELFHNALLNDRYGSLLREHVTKGLLGTEDHDGFLWKMPQEKRVALLEKFRDAYMELDDTSPNDGAQRANLKQFNEAIDEVKQGKKPSTLYPIFEELAESYFGKYIKDKPIDYLLRGDSPLNNFADIVWNSGLDTVHRLMKHDVEAAGGRIQFKAGNPEGFFLDSKGRRVIIPELDRVMKMVVDKMRKDTDTVRGFPARKSAELTGNEITFKELDHLYKDDGTGKMVRKTDAEYNAEQEGKFTSFFARHAKMDPANKGLRFTEIGGETEQSPAGAYMPANRRPNLKATKKLIAENTAEYEKNQRELEAAEKRKAKVLEKQQKKGTEFDEADLEYAAHESQFEGKKQFKISGYMTEAEKTLFTDVFGSTIANRVFALTRTIHSKGIDGNNIMQFVYSSDKRQKFNFDTKGRPTGEDNTRYEGTEKERHILPYEVVLKFERKRLTLLEKEQMDLEDTDVMYKVGNPQLMVNGIDYYAIDRRVNYMFNHMRPMDAARSVGSGYVKSVYASEAEMHFDIKRLLSNYSRGEVAMAGADFFGGGKIGRAKRDIINAAIGAHPPKDGFSESYMQDQGFHYPLHAQLRNAHMNEAFTPWTSLRLDRISGRINHLQGEGFFYDHDYAHAKAQGNYAPRQAMIPTSFTKRPLNGRIRLRYEEPVSAAWADKKSQGIITRKFDPSVSPTYAQKRGWGSSKPLQDNVDPLQLMLVRIENRTSNHSSGMGHGGDIISMDGYIHDLTSGMPEKVGEFNSQIMSLDRAIHDTYLKRYGLPKDILEMQRMAYINETGIEPAYQSLGLGNVLYAEGLEHLRRRGVEFLLSGVINKDAEPVAQRIKRFGQQNVFGNVGTYDKPSWEVVTQSDAADHIAKNGSMAILAKMVAPKGGFQPVQRHQRDHHGYQVSVSDSIHMEESAFKTPTGEPMRMYASRKIGDFHISHFSEASTVSRFNEHTVGYLSVRPEEILDITGHGNVPHDYLSRFDKKDLHNNGFRAIKFQHEGEVSVAFTDFQDFKQTGISLLDTISGNFAPRQKKKLTYQQQIDQEAKNIRIEMASINKNRASIQQRKDALMRKLQRAEREKRKGKPEEEQMKAQRQLRVSLEQLDEAEANATVMRSVFRDSSIDLVRAGRPSLAVIASLSNGEYARYKEYKELPADIEKRHIEMVDAVLMDHWVRRSALRKASASRKEAFEATEAFRDAKARQYEEELKKLEEELITSLSAYKMFDIADNLLGTVPSTERVEMRSRWERDSKGNPIPSTYEDITAEQGRAMGVTDIPEGRKSGRSVKENFTLLDAAYQTMTESAAGDGHRSPTQRLIMLTQALAKQFEIEGKATPEFKARLDQMRQQFTQTYELTNTNLRKSAAEILRHGLHSLRWTDELEFNKQDNLGRWTRSGDVVRSSLGTSGHYVQQYKPEQPDIGLNFKKLKLPESMKFEKTSVQVTGRKSGDKYVSDVGLADSIEALRKELIATVTKNDVGDGSESHTDVEAHLKEASPQQIADIAFSKKGWEGWDGIDEVRNGRNAKRIRDFARGEKKVQTYTNNAQILTHEGRPTVAILTEKGSDAPWQTEGGRTVFPSAEEGLRVVPFREIEVVEINGVKHYHWNKDTTLSGESKSKAYRNFDEMLLEYDGMKTIARLTYGYKKGEYTAHRANGWKIMDKKFPSLEEAKRAAIIDLNENNAADVVFQSLKRVSDEQAESILRLITHETEIEYENPNAQRIVKKKVPNPDYDPDKPSGLGQNLEMIDERRTIKAGDIMPEWKNLAVFKSGDMLLVTSDSKNALISSVARTKKGTKAKTSDVLKQAEEASGNFSSKAIGDVYKIIFDDSGNFTGIERVDRLTTVEALNKWVGTMSDPQTASFEAARSVADRLTKQFSEVIKPKFVEERKKIANVLINNPKLIKAKVEQQRQIQAEVLQKLKERNIKDFAQLEKAITELDGPLEQLSDRRDSHLLFLSRRGYLLRPEVAKRLIKDGVFANIDELKAHEQFMTDSRQVHNKLRIPDEYAPAEQGAISQGDMAALIEHALSEAKRASDETMLPLGKQEVLMDIQDKIKGETYQQLVKEIEDLELQLHAAQGGKVNQRSALAKVRIGKKRSIVKQMSEVEWETYKMELARDKKPAPETDVALSEYEAKVSMNVEPRQDFYTMPRFIPLEGESYLSPHKMHQRFKHAMADMIGLHKATIDESNPNRVNLNDYLHDDSVFDIADNEATRRDIIGDANLNVKQNSGGIMAWDKSPEGTDFKLKVNKFMADELAHRLSKANLEKKLALQEADPVKRDAMLEKLFAEAQGKYDIVHKINSDTLVDSYAKLPEPLRVQYEDFLRHHHEMLDATRTRIRAETAEYIREATVKQKELDLRLETSLKKFQEMGITSDPMRVFPADHKYQAIFPTLWSEFYPTRDEVRAGYQRTKATSESTGVRVKMENAEGGKRPIQWQSGEQSTYQFDQKYSERQGNIIGGQISVDSVLKNVSDGEAIEGQIRALRGLREIDLFDKALSYANRLQSEYKRTGQPVGIDAEDLKLVSLYFPDIINPDGPNHVPVKDTWRAEYENSLKTISPDSDVNLEVQKVNTLYNHWVKQAMNDQPKMYLAIARVSGEARLAELTRPENLVDGKMDWSKLKIEEADYILHTIPQIKTGIAKYTSVSELVSNPQYIGYMLSLFSNEAGEISSIFSGQDANMKTKTWLGLEGDFKSRNARGIVEQIDKTGDNIAIENKTQAHSDASMDSAEAWYTGIEQALTQQGRDKITATQQVLLELAKTESAVKIYKGRVEQFLNSRPDAKANLLALNDDLKLISANPEPVSTQLKYNDFGMPEIVNPDPSDAFFRTPNGKFVAFKHGDMFKLFFTGDDAGVKVPPSHVMTAPDLERIQIGIRFFADDLRSAQVLATSMAGQPVLPAKQLGSYSKNFFDVHGGSLPPQVIEALTAELAKIGQYSETTYIQTGNNKRQITIYPNTDVWDRLHNGDYEKVNGSWKLRDEVVEARQQLLDTSKALAEQKRPSVAQQLDTGSTKGVTSGPPPTVPHSDRVDAKTTWSVVKEGNIMVGDSPKPAFQDWTAVQNSEGFVILRQQAIDARNRWTSDFVVFSPNGIMISKEKSEQEAVSSIFKHSGR